MVQARQKPTMIKSKGIISRVVRKAEVKDTDSVVKRLEHGFFLAAKLACVWESVAGSSGAWRVVKYVLKKTYGPVKRVRDAWVASE